MIREELLALADELEGMECSEGCRTCPADGTNDCRGDLSCEEAVARAAARRIREVVEHDACEDTTVSAYDLLSEEDRKALAWAREHGGLGAVEKRLMPEGMEWLLDVWPKWSNGEYCKFGDWWKSDEYGESEPKQFNKLTIYTPEQLMEWWQDDGDNYGYAWDFMRPSDPKYRPDKAEPPAPKVLDADGVEIRVGDVLYSIELGDSVTVGNIEPGNPWFAETDGALQHCAKFTHRAPILAADGKPLREGETVYDVEDENGYPHIVTSTELNGFGHVKTTCEEPTPASVSIHPNRLTHEQPDTWERLEADAELSPADYISKYGRKTKLYEYEEVPRDLVRRCRALAERCGR